MPTGRQGNLIVTSTKSVSENELREMLKAEAKKQGKEYGLYFEDISSGFAVTNRRSPQAFSVIPLVVYRVYVDGRPDELVRGVSIVGTPQAALNRIVATGNKQDVFNGICGAESGSIPVSAVAPAMLVSEIETQRQSQGNSRPPIVPPPGAPQRVASAVGWRANDESVREVVTDCGWCCGVRYRNGCFFARKFAARWCCRWRRRRLRLIRCWRRCRVSWSGSSSCCCCPGCSGRTSSSTGWMTLGALRRWRTLGR